jgi:hypothetical protein
LTSRELFTNNSSRQVKQSVRYTAVTFYVNCVKVCEDFVVNFGCIKTKHCLALPFSPGNFRLKTTWLSSSTHPTFLCFPDWR